MASIIPRHRALKLLAECTGDEIWSVAHCEAAGVPADWIRAHVDNFESGFRSDLQTIYVGDAVTNQYRGVRDVDIAVEAARAMGIDVERLTANVLGRRGIVLAIKQAIFEGDE